MAPFWSGVPAGRVCGSPAFPCRLSHVTSSTARSILRRTVLRLRLSASNTSGNFRINCASIRPLIMKPVSRSHSAPAPRGEFLSLKWLTALLFLVSILAVASQAASAPAPF